MEKKGFGWLGSYLRIGCIGFGGGTALVPVVEREVVDKDRLVSKEDYDKDVLVASVTPGALPVEISGCNGKRIAGFRGMLAAAACMAGPGVLMALALLTFLSASSGAVLEQVQLVAIGITVFILSMLTGYFSKTVKWARGQNRLGVCVVIMLGVLVLNCGKSLYKVLGIFGVEGSALLSVSTVDILMLVFFFLLYTHCRFTPLRTVVACAVSLAYLLCVCKAQVISSEVVLHALQVAMFVLAVYGVVSDRADRGNIRKIPLAPLLREEGVWLLFLLVLSIPGFLAFGGYAEYLLRGLFSSFISFGGGDAYLTVADSLFVSTNSAVSVSSEDFYGKIVTVVNVVPGSILCKTLSSIGYYLGLAATDSIAGGLAVALGGCAISIGGACSVVTLVQYLLAKFEDLREFELLKRWTKAIVSGLLGSVMLSLIYTCLSLADTYSLSLAAIGIELAAFYVLNLFLVHKTNVGTGTQVALSIILALVTGNVVLL